MADVSTTGAGRQEPSIMRYQLCECGPTRRGM